MILALLRLIFLDVLKLVANQVGYYYFSSFSFLVLVLTHSIYGKVQAYKKKDWYA
jgi:hypothetical protein